MNAQQRATAWRNYHGYTGKGGVVIVFDDQVAGWVDELRDPQHWEPGAVAFDEAGKAWVATGGDRYHGARTWEPVGRSLLQNG